MLRRIVGAFIGSVIGLLYGILIALAVGACIDYFLERLAGGLPVHVAPGTTTPFLHLGWAVGMILGWWAGSRE